MDEVLYTTGSLYKYLKSTISTLAHFARACFFLFLLFNFVHNVKFPNLRFSQQREHPTVKARRTSQICIFDNGRFYARDVKLV